MMQVAEYPELTFEERQHIYKLNGVAIPSVTTIMEPLSDQVYSTVSDAVLRKAGNRGTAVHNAIENYVKFGIEDIAPEHAGYFDAFLRWYDDHKVVPYGTEVRLYHKGLLYAGTADMMAEVDSVDTLIDFKTTSSVSTMLCGVQLEAYDRAAASHTSGAHFQKKAIVHLSKDGKYEMIPFSTNDTECWRVFTALLTVRNYKQKFK
jgi:hypothetical protein